MLFITPKRIKIVYGHKNYTSSLFLSRFYLKLLQMPLLSTLHKLAKTSKPMVVFAHGRIQEKQMYLYNKREDAYDP